MLVVMVVLVDGWSSLGSGRLTEVMQLQATPSFVTD